MKPVEDANRAVLDMLIPLLAKPTVNIVLMEDSHQSQVQHDAVYALQEHSVILQQHIANLVALVDSVLLLVLQVVHFVLVDWLQDVLDKQDVKYALQVTLQLRPALVVHVLLAV